MSADGSVLAIEGIDGCGKSTVAALLVERLRELGLSVAPYDFPRYDEPRFGPLIAQFLRGGFGSMPLAEPWFVGMLFAANRAESAPSIRDDLKAGRIVVSDRFTYSNVAFQSSKLSAPHEVPAFIEWLMSFELETLATPKADVSFWLRVAPEKRPAAGSARGQRGYLDGAPDIHEANEALQVQVHATYERLSALYDDIEVIDCVDGEKLLSPELICDAILARLAARAILPRSA